MLGVSLVAGRGHARVLNTEQAWAIGSLPTCSVVTGIGCEGHRLRQLQSDGIHQT